MQLDPKSHRYHLNDDEYTSVTTLVHKCFKPFDADKILQTMKIKGTKYEGMSKEEIKEEWNKNAKDAQQQGTHIHSVIERYYKKEYIMEEEWKLPEIIQFKSFTELFPVVPYGVEWLVYSEQDKLAGTIDFVAENEDGTLDLYDWKRSKHMELYNPFNKYSHVVHIPDTNFWHYTVQLNLYKYIIEKCYHKKVNRMYLVCFYPTQLTFKKYEVENIQQHIAAILTIKT